MASIRFVDVDPEEDLENESPVHGVQFADALEAFEAFARCKDVGFAMENATYNLEMPTGKMYTKNFDRKGLVSAR